LVAEQLAKLDAKLRFRLVPAAFSGATSETSMLMMARLVYLHIAQTLFTKEWILRDHSVQSIDTTQECGVSSAIFGQIMPGHSTQMLVQ
jgi:hypothetical protein